MECLGIPNKFLTVKPETLDSGEIDLKPGEKDLEKELLALKPALAADPKLGPASTLRLILPPKW
jgi:hypothetical protein